MMYLLCAPPTLGWAQETDLIAPLNLEFSQLPAPPKPRFKPRVRATPTPDSLPLTRVQVQELFAPPIFAPPSILYPNKLPARATKTDIVPAEARFASSQIPFYALFALLAGLTIVLSTNRNYFFSLITNLKDQRFADLSSQERLFVGSLSAFFFDILFFITTSLLAFRLFEFYKIPLYIGEKLLSVFEILVIFLVFYLAKNIIYRLFGYLFDLKKTIGQYLYQVSALNRIIGIVLVPLLFLAFYSQSASYAYILVLMGVTLIGGTFFRYFRGIKLAAQTIKTNFFYFLLFIIAIEILPVLLIIKTIKP